MIESERELRELHNIHQLEPFGVRIDGQSTDFIENISGNLIEHILYREKLVLFRGFHGLSRDGFLSYIRDHLAKSVLEWDFGPVMEMKESPDPKNYLFSSERVPYHWDGAFHRVPSYLAFNCVTASQDENGGETNFANTEKIWREANASEHALWSNVRLTYETRKLAHYGGIITGPLVQKHPVTGAKILRFAEAVKTDLNPVRLSISGISEALQPRFVEDLTSRVYRSEFRYKHQWRQNDILIADNHSLIHGREAFTRNGPRHLRRIQIL